MSEETLLVIFIGMVAIAWFAMGVIAVLIGVRIIKILDEVQSLASRVRRTGEATMEDLDLVRERVRAQGSKIAGAFEFLVGFATRSLRPHPTRKRKAAAEPTEEKE